MTKADPHNQSSALIRNPSGDLYQNREMNHSPSARTFNKSKASIQFLQGHEGDSQHGISPQESYGFLPEM